MHNLLRVSTLLCVIALLAWQQTPVSADAKEGEWAKGWNTWKSANKGDWAEYSIGGMAKIRQEVIKAEGGEITYEHSTFDAKGTETSKKELTKDWASIKLQGKLPYKKENIVVWKEATLVLEGVTLECDLAEWVLGGTQTQIYFCKAVPCGGIVKTTTGGTDSVWLTGFHTEKSGEIKTGDGTAEATKSELPRFWATTGNMAVLKISGTGRDDAYQRREIVSVAETSSKYSIVACDKDGAIDEKATPVEREQTKEAWDTDYGKPSETGVTLKVAAGEFKCDVFKVTDEKSGKVTTEWISEGAPVKKVIKTKTSETVLELAKIEWK